MSAVIWIEAWPSRYCTILSGSSSPPSARRLMHQLRIEMPERMQAAYLALPSAIDDAGGDLRRHEVCRHDVLLAG